jgi:MFS family permease
VRYLLAGVLVNQLGAFVQTFLLLYLTHRGVALATAAAALVGYSAGAIVGTMLGGELTHRYGPRATIVAAMATSAPLVAALPWLSAPGRGWLLLADVALAGLATQAYRPAAGVLLSDLMPPRYAVLGFSMMRIALNTGAALGPLLAAGLILLDWDLLFWVDGATALAYAALAYVLLPRTTPPAREAGEAAEAATPGRVSAYAVLVRDRRYLAYLGAVLVGTVGYVQFMVALPLQITADGHPAALYSAVLATSSLVLIACELKLTTYITRWPPQVAGVLGHVVFGLGLAGWGLSAHSAGLVLASTVVFVSGLMISGPSMYAHPAAAPGAVKARYLATMHSVAGLGSTLGPALGVLAWTRLHAGAWLLFGLGGLVAAALAGIGMAGRPGAAAEPTVADRAHEPVEVRA